MGGEQVTPLTADAVRKAVAQLKAVNAITQYAMMDAFFSEKLFDRLNTMWIDTNDRPDWIQKLEKEWGIR